MAYKIMKTLISNGSKTKEELAEMADVYYASGRLTKEQYEDIIDRLNNMSKGEN